MIGQYLHRSSSPSILKVVDRMRELRRIVSFLPLKIKTNCM